MAEIPFALVSMVDSSPEVSQMPWARSYTNGAEASASSSLLLSAAILLGIVEAEKVFYGFDEVWFSVNRDPVRPRPGMLTAPRNLVESPLRADEASTTADMLLGLGDGYGLNFVANDRPLATKLGLGGA